MNARTPQPVDANVARAAQLDTATLSDALDKHGLVGQRYKMKPRMTGRAWTLLYGPASCFPNTTASTGAST
jgi:4-hydroxy-4-methyl-2-oxoglutarate aldolase